MAMLIQLSDDSAGIKVPLDKPQLSIGRGDENDISIDDELVSKSHALIEAVPSEEEPGRVDFFIHDQESTNRTYVNEQLVTLHRLKHDDVIRIGKNNFRFVDEQTEEMEETSKLHKSWIPGVYYTKKKKK